MKKLQKIYLGIKGIVQEQGFLPSLLIFSAKLLYYVFEYNLIRVLKHKKLEVDKKKILFVSELDFSDNARALFEYMVSNNFQNRYELVWLVSDPDAFMSHLGSNIKFIREKRKNARCRTISAYYHVWTSHKVFFTHNINWAYRENKDQQYINLWHGCGYKRAKRLTNPILFDACLVPGELFIETKKEFFQCGEEKIIPLGYPRYDLLFQNNKNAKNFVEQRKLQSGAKKVVIWMPTFRRSNRLRISDQTLNSKLDIPLVGTPKDLDELNDFCRSNHIYLIIKKHHYQIDYGTQSRSHLLFLDDSVLEKNDIQLYHLLSLTDGLISDYSSVVFDYLLVDKPIGYVLIDYEEYKKSRGFVFENPLQYMPGRHIYKIRDLEGFLYDISQNIDLDQEKRENIKKLAHIRHQGEYSRSIVNYFGLEGK